MVVVFIFFCRVWVGPTVRAGGDFVLCDDLTRLSIRRDQNLAPKASTQFQSQILFPTNQKIVRLATAYGKP